MCFQTFRNYGTRIITDHFIESHCKKSPVTQTTGAGRGHMKSFEFIVEGVPKGKGRPRFTTIGGYTRTYTPKTTKDYEALVAEAYRENGGTVFEYPFLDVRINAYFPIPKSVKKSDRLLMGTGFYPHNKKPDCDNIAKSILDGLNGIAWTDDKQVVSLKIKKLYDNVPHVYVRIKEMEVDKDASRMDLDTQTDKRL